MLQATILEWVAFPFSRGSFQPRDQTQVSRIVARFFTSWALPRIAEMILKQRTKLENSLFSIQNLLQSYTNQHSVVLA